MYGESKCAIIFDLLDSKGQNQGHLQLEGLYLIKELS